MAGKAKGKNKGKKTEMQARKERRVEVAKTKQPNREAITIANGKFEGRSKTEQQKDEFRVLSLMHPADMTGNQRNAFEALKQKYGK